MVRPTCLFTAVVLSFASGCTQSVEKAKPGKDGAPAKVTAPPGGGGVSPDDALGRAWVQSLNDYAEVLEKNGTGDQRRAASAKSQEAIRAIQALPQERIAALRERFKNEIAAAEARAKKAQEGAGPGAP